MIGQRTDLQYFLIMSQHALPSASKNEAFAADSINMLLS